MQHHHFSNSWCVQVARRYGINVAFFARTRKSGAAWRRINFEVRVSTLSHHGAGFARKNYCFTGGHYCGCTGINLCCLELNPVAPESLNAVKSIIAHTTKILPAANWDAILTLA
jgi:hypothetical protein